MTLDGDGYPVLKMDGKDITLKGDVPGQGWETYKEAVLSKEDNLELKKRLKAGMESENVQCPAIQCMKLDAMVGAGDGENASGPGADKDPLTLCKAADEYSGPPVASNGATETQTSVCGRDEVPTTLLSRPPADADADPLGLKDFSEQKAWETIKRLDRSLKRRLVTEDGQQQQQFSRTKGDSTCAGWKERVKYLVCKDRCLSPACTPEEAAAQTHAMSCRPAVINNSSGHLNGYHMLSQKLTGQYRNHFWERKPVKAGDRSGGLAGYRDMPLWCIREYYPWEGKCYASYTWCTWNKEAASGMGATKMKKLPRHCGGYWQDWTPADDVQESKKGWRRNTKWGDTVEVEGEELDRVRASDSGIRCSEAALTASKTELQPELQRQNFLLTSLVPHGKEVKGGIMSGYTGTQRTFDKRLKDAAESRDVKVMSTVGDRDVGHNKQQGTTEEIPTEEFETVMNATTCHETGMWEIDDGKEIQAVFEATSENVYKQMVIPKDAEDQKNGWVLCQAEASTDAPGDTTYTSLEAYRSQDDEEVQEVAAGEEVHPASLQAWSELR